MTYIESLFSLQGKTAVVIGGTGVLCSEIAQAMAGAEKKYPGTTPSGPTEHTAPQRRQRYRRTRTSVSRGGHPGHSGPQICRGRRPCPCSMSLPPWGWPATLQAGHRAGRASVTDGTC